jgi:hypothetical protein
MADSRTRVEEYRARLSWLERDAMTWLAHGREVQEYVVPTRGRLLTNTKERPNEGNKKHGSIYNGRASVALDNLASGIHSNLTSPMQPWFSISLTEKELLEVEGVRAWLESCTRRLAHVMSQSDFYGAAAVLFKEVAAFGSGVMLIEDPRPGRIRYTPLTFGEFFLALNDENDPDTLYRRLPMTVSQVVSKFGTDNLSPHAKELSKDNRNADERIDIIHVIQPRAVINRGSGVRALPFESVYFEETTDGKILWDRGYRTLPFAAPRWEVITGGTYGRSRCMGCLGDIKMLQWLERMSARAINYQVDPSMNVPYALKRQGGASLIPGAQNYYDGVTPDAIRPTMNINFDVQGVEAKITMVEQRIKEFLYNDRFLSITEQTQRMTATEVRARQLEKLSVLAPVVQQLQTAFLTPVIERTFDILWRYQMLPPPPPEIQGRAWTPEYNGLLSQAQKAAGVSSLDALISYVQQIAAAQSTGGTVDSLDKVDFDQAIDEVSDYVGAPAKVIRSDEQVAAIRDDRARLLQQAQQAQQMQQLAASAPQVAGAAKDASETIVGGGKTALDGLLGLNQ